MLKIQHKNFNKDRFWIYTNTKRFLLCRLLFNRFCCIFRQI